MLGVGDVVPRPGFGWHESAACKGEGTEKFYRDERGPYVNLGWREICSVCPVRSDCLANALREEELWGVWGGFTPNARRRLVSELLEGTVRWEQVARALVAPPDVRGV